jgi:hypothetical protein
VPGIRGPLTAAQAFQIAHPAAVQYDPLARLVLVVSDEDISEEGDSHQWSFRFDLPQQRAQVRVRVASDLAVETRDRPPVLCTEQVRPFPDPDSEMAAWLAEGAVSQTFVNEQWLAHQADNPALPIPFRDSPEAVRSLREQGVDFIGGDPHMVLRSKVLANGQAVWAIYAYHVEYHTPFARSDA